VEPLGAVKPVPVDLRVIAATHRDLREMVRNGTFREDLYFRLAVVPIHLPPLREREGDVALLANHMLRTFAEKHGKAFQNFSPEAMAALQAYHWPGNVRELRNLIEQVVVLWDGITVELEHLPELPGPERATAGKPSRPAHANPAGPPLKDAVSRLKAGYEQERILQALRECGGNRTQAAKLLGISRRALQLKLKALEQERGAWQG
jgi:two-component system response regulator AtoC